MTFLRRHLKLFNTVLALVLALCYVLIPIPVFAIADPDTPTNIGMVEVYESVLETGDLGVLLDFYIDYATLPTESATEAYEVVFVDTDGTTPLKTIVPYSLLYNGYHESIAWIYFTAAEVTADTIVVANMALYTVEVNGNAALVWVPGPAPPSTSDVIDTWNTTGDPNVLLAVDVLTYATNRETDWSLDMIRGTTVGNKLSTYGEQYFENVIANARTAAPNAFYNDVVSPIIEEIDYTTEFGATMTNGTGTCTGSPITLVSGANTVAVTVAGTFVLELEQGTMGYATTIAGGGGGTVTGSPVRLVQGTNTITVPGGGTGNILVTVQLENTQTQMDDSILGTGLDLTAVATRFGMSRLAFSGLVWLAITIIICAAAYERAGGKSTLLIFDICFLGGSLLGLLSVLISALLFLGCVLLTAYVMFYQKSSA